MLNKSIESQQNMWELMLQMKQSWSWNVVKVCNFKQVDLDAGQEGCQEGKFGHMLDIKNHDKAIKVIGVNHSTFGLHIKKLVSEQCTLVEAPSDNIKSWEGCEVSN